MSVVRKCGKLEELIDAAVVGLDRGGFLSEDGKKIPFGKYFIYRFRKGQCSIFEPLELKDDFKCEGLTNQRTSCQRAKPKFDAVAV